MWLALYEFANAQPVIEYWTTEQGEIAGVITIWPDRWRIQASPGFREPATLKYFAERADFLCSTLTNNSKIDTQAYTSSSTHVTALEALGYRKEAATEVFMVCKLAERQTMNLPTSVFTTSQQDPEESAQRTVRALIQADAFSGEDASDEMIAWHLRNGDRMPTYSANNIDFLATTKQGQAVGIASIQLDLSNKIAEIEPVGTLTSFQRRGIAGLLLNRCLDHMTKNLIEQAFVRTGVENTSAIAAYESVGFEVRDYLHCYSRPLP